MGAKVAGIGLVGLTQIIDGLFSWILFLLFGAYAESSGMLTEIMAENGELVAATLTRLCMLMRIWMSYYGFLGCR